VVWLISGHPYSISRDARDGNFNPLANEGRSTAESIDRFTHAPIEPYHAVDRDQLPFVFSHQAAILATRMKL
jgi:hypothetical protein